ncbi:MAG: T9SS type A sorting domain-containing protein [Bacteroidetes bacterium]|nr:T9SS type A sorting domain-containing protein [Bacteroidota bacterium]
MKKGIICAALLAVSSFVEAQINGQRAEQTSSPVILSEFDQIVPGRYRISHSGDTIFPTGKGPVAVTSVQVKSPGEYLMPLRSNPVQAEFAGKYAMQRSAVAPGDTITLPANGSGITDDFSYDSHIPDTVLWNRDAVQPNNGNYSGVFINRGWAIAPIDIGVCTFDGLDFTGMPYDPLAGTSSVAPADYLTSNWFNLSSKTIADSVYIRFFWQAQGRGYAPNASDSFLLQFNYPAIGNDWETVWFQTGYTPSFSDTNFHVAMVKLDNPAYFANGFRFRFRNYASICGSNDHWHLDNVRIKELSNINDTVVGGIRYAYEPKSLLVNYTQMPWWHYNQSPLPVVTNQRLFVRNNGTQSTSFTNAGFEVRNSSSTLLFSANNSGGSFCTSYAIDGFYDDPTGPNVWNPTMTAITGFPAMTGPDYFTTDYEFSAGAQGRDSARAVQRFNNFYAYDDGTAEVGYGLYGVNSLLAYQFTLPAGVTDTLKAVQMYFLPVQDIDNIDLRQFRLTVWSNGAGNQPGTIIYQQSGETPDYSTDAPNRFVTYTIDSGLVVLSGTYYIGWQQFAIDRMYIGFDFNNNRSDKIFYNTNGTWYTSIFEGALMMRPVFRTGPDLSGVDENEVTESNLLFPNPASGTVQIRNWNGSEQFAAEAIDMTGRTILQTQVSNGSIDISALPAGVYFFRLRNLQTDAFSTQRIVVAQ